MRTKEQSDRFERGSLTVECAFILPIFFMACVTLIVFMEAVRIQAKTELALSNRARYLAVVGAAGGEHLDDRWIDLRKTEKLAFPFGIFSVPVLRIACRARVYPWVGIEFGEDGAADSEDMGGTGMVYVTDTRSVYHLYADCSHLKLTVMAVPYEDIKGMRNTDGSRYRPCRGFPENFTGTVYVTQSGDYYYPSADHAGITRHVHMVPAEDCGTLKLCSRCAARLAGSGGSPAQDAA